MAEWLNARDCKSRSRLAYGGSNPSLPTFCPDSSEVERFHGKKEVVGSSPTPGSWLKQIKNLLSCYVPNAVELTTESINQNKWRAIWN